MNKRGLITILILMTIIATVVVFWIVSAAPETTTHQDNLEDHSQCLRGSAGECLVFPTVTGVDLDSQPITFPDAFAGRYNLVVMPFDREQQVLAETWLPFFQDLAASYSGIDYYNIAALPNLNAGVRVLVIGGMSMGVSEPDLRQRITVLFLEDQQTFLEALEIEAIESIQVYITDEKGVVFWRGAGTYDEGLGDQLKTALDDLMN